MKASAGITALILTLLLSACGWQLRGTTSKPNLETLTVTGASTELRYTLEDELENQGVLVHGESPYLLVIDDEDWMRRTSAVDAQGRQAEIELRYTLYWHQGSQDRRPAHHAQTDDGTAHPALVSGERHGIL